MIELEKLNEFTESHGALRTGKGLVSGVIALTLAILCLLGVLAFHFPQYLTTPELRKSYDVNVIRTIMLAAMAIAGGISLVNILFNRARWLATFAFAMVALAALLGGAAAWLVMHFAPIPGGALVSAIVAALFGLLPAALVLRKELRALTSL